MTINYEQVSAELLQWLSNTAQSTTDFLTTQTPLYVQELLAWSFVYYTAWCVVNIVLMVPFIYIIRQAVKEYQRTDSQEEQDFCVFLVFLALIITGCVFGASCYNASQAIKIKVAPRVYLVDYILDKTGK